MRAQSKADEKWYRIFKRLNAQLDAAARADAQAFMRWSANPQGPMPVKTNVDALQLARSQHMDTAPNDEPDDELEAMMCRERLAQEHRDGMGFQKGYTLPLRHTQTKQYYESLGEGSDFFLDEDQATDRLMANAYTAILPRPDNPTSQIVVSEARVRNRMTAALAAYQERNSDEDFSVTEADRDRLLGLGSSTDTADGFEEDKPEDTPAEPMEEDKAEHGADHSMLDVYAKMPISWV